MRHFFLLGSVGWNTVGADPQPTGFVPVVYGNDLSKSIFFHRVCWVISFIRIGKVTDQTEKASYQ
jgi:hypothetical protein